MFISNLKNYRNGSKQLVSSISLFIILPIIILRFLGLLQPAEWAAYDLLFHLSPDEPQDEKIVLVVWDEDNLQMLEETTISDRSLSFVLDTIRKQQPRVIGLDIYRDVPVTSRLLSNEQNERAYDRLNQIFRETDNLIGIEKVWNPTIPPSKVLFEEGRAASSDIIVDRDNIIRRSFTDPQPLKDKNDPESYRPVPYIGVELAYSYLVREGWQVSSKVGEKSLKLKKDEREIVLQDLGDFDGAYVNNKPQLDFLVNWRRNDRPFVEVSVADLAAGSLPNNFFRDKIVIIGNTASSNADRHFLPTDRWGQESPQWTYGIEILAQVTSSIVSAAEDNRPLIRVFPGGIGYWLMAISSVAIATIVIRYQNMRAKKLYLISSLCALGLTFILGIISLIAFQSGWWIPIVPAIVSIWLTVVVINNKIHLEKELQKEREIASKLRIQISKFTHKIGNEVNSMNLAIESIIRLSDLSSCSGNVAKLNQNLAKIHPRADKLTKHITMINRHIERARQLENVLGSMQLKPRPINVNERVKQIVAEINQEHQTLTSLPIVIQEYYDPTLKIETVDPDTIETILSNLIDNAFSALESRYQEQTKGYLPKILISTEKTHNSIKIAVEDNGIGIPLEKQTKIFDLFVSYKGDRGQGIGLSIVKELLSLERGKIEVESTEGQGSTFTFFLPRKPNYHHN